VGVFCVHCRKKERALQNRNQKRKENVLYYKIHPAIVAKTSTCDTLVYYQQYSVFGAKKTSVF
jgi:hypothetical protein